MYATPAKIMIDWLGCYQKQVGYSPVCIRVVVLHYKDPQEGIHQLKSDDQIDYS